MIRLLCCLICLLEAGSIYAQQAILTDTSYREGENVYFSLRHDMVRAVIASDITTEDIIIDPKRRLRDNIRTAWNLMPAEKEAKEQPLKIQIGRIWHAGLFTFRVATNDKESNTLMRLFAYDHTFKSLRSCILPAADSLPQAGRNIAFTKIINIIKASLQSDSAKTELPLILDTLAEREGRLLDTTQRYDMALILTVDNPGIYLIGDTAKIDFVTVLSKKILQRILPWSGDTSSIEGLNAAIDMLIRKDLVHALPIDTIITPAKLNVAKMPPPNTLANLFYFYAGTKNIQIGNFVRFLLHRERFEQVILMIKLRPETLSPK